MEKPNLTDFGLSDRLIHEILEYNKKQHRSLWIAIHMLCAIVTLTVCLLVPTSYQNKTIIFFGFVYTFYFLGWVSIFQLAAAPFFKAHPKTENQNHYSKEFMKYKASIKKSEASTK